MRKAVLAVLVLISGCSAAGAIDAPPETFAAPITAAAPGETAQSTSTTVAATTITLPSHGLPIPPSTSVPPLPTTTLPSEDPVFEYAIHEVSADTVALSWREECPLHWEELTMLTLSYWNFDGRPVKGRMVVNTAVVEDVAAAFEGLFNIKFPIERIALVDDYGGDDREAMRHNVTSGFNCRFVDGTERWSNHAFGLAVDINPLINPWAREGDFLPLEGTRFADRDKPVPGMINVGDKAVTIFEQLGWSWGGVWQSADYMHFSKPGN